jgi:hypothetical protein
MFRRSPDILGGPGPVFSPRRGSLYDETDDLRNGDDQNGEHQMAHHLRRRAHLDGSTAVVVFEVGVDPFGAAALVVADVLSGGMADERSAPFFLRQLLLQRRVAAGVDVDDRHVAERAAMRLDLGRIVGAVREIVEIGETP